jgi:hypothetical protein
MKRELLERRKSNEVTSDSAQLISPNVEATSPTSSVPILRLQCRKKDKVLMTPLHRDG